MYQQFHTKIPYSAHKVHLYAQNKQWLFKYTALTDWFYNRDGYIYYAVRIWVFKHDSD
jgi:hypothetical protein